MTNQHTAQPWGAFEILDGIAIKDSRNVTIAYCDYATEADEIELAEGETEANARLIAAAPELLDALEDLVGRDETEARESGFADDEMSWLEDARRAIAKAKGGASWSTAPHASPSLCTPEN